MEDEPLWTVRRTARYLAVSETTLRSWQQAHLLPFLKIGGSIRFVPEEIRHWVFTRAVAPREGAPLCAQSASRRIQPPPRTLKEGR